ncbi:MAG: hypothetical protein A3F09_02930 [Chlamydiae bacterium RIFCSPHIGHO2_12_FULL_49_11]|nr:MAG: hypothetical protein A3F09_02930 [Chlamydiae bacterium RIFCSPHIGHO2_12_FULL_49_11]
MKELFEVKFNEVKQYEAYTELCFSSASKRFSIFAQPQIGEWIREYKTGEYKSRPQAPEFVSSLLKGFNIKPCRLTFTGEKEGVYFSTLLLEKAEKQLTELLEIDVRPSDGLMVALHFQIPIFALGSFINNAS